MYIINLHVDHQINFQSAQQKSLYLCRGGHRQGLYGNHFQEQKNKELPRNKWTQLRVPIKNENV